MTRNEAVALVKQVLGFMANRDSTIISNMQFQQTQLELSPTKPWFLLSEIEDLTTVDGQTYVSTPLDFLDEYDEGGMWYYDSTAAAGYEWVEMKKDDYDVLKRNYRGAEAGPPEAYALVGSEFQLFPTPDDAYTLKYLYYKKDETLESNIENQWLKFVPGLLIGKAGAMLAASLRDMEAIKIFDKMTQEAMLLLENQNEARKYRNFEMQIGGPH